MSPLLPALAAGAPDLGHYLAVCGLAVLAVLGLGVGFRRIVAGTMRARAARRSLAVVDVLPLGGKQRLAVVRCYDRSFLVGIGEREVSLVAELDPDEEPASEEAGASAGGRGFAELVRAAAPSGRTEPPRRLAPRGVLG